MKRYTIKDFQRDFPDDAACLEWLKDYRWPNGIRCKECKKVTKHHLMKTRRSYSCQECGEHVHPTAGTIFHKSTTPLTLWFYTVYQMAQTRGGISAKQIERETGVTYKTAWRMCRLIRQQLSEDNGPFSGEVEVDEAYFGGKRSGTTGRGAAGKTPVIGMAERKGQIKAVAVPDIKGKTILPIIRDTVKKGTTVYSDELKIYDGVGYMGYTHKRILHSAGIYVMGDVYTNTVEGFWSLVKRGISGVYHSVSPKYLQHYINEYAFRYNRRNNKTPMFHSFLCQVGLPSGG